MRPFKIIILTLCIALYYTSFLHAQTIKYIGLPVMNAFIRSAAKGYTDVSFEIITKPDTHTFSISDLLNDADIIGFTDKIDPEFVSVGANFFLIGRDAIGIWVNKKNPVTNLSFDDLYSIYSGKIRNWDKYYPSGGLIHLFNIPIHSPCNAAFKNIVFKHGHTDSSLIEYVGSKAMLLKQISQTPGGIGFFSISTAKGHKSLHLVRPVPVENQMAGITNGDYPITRPLYLVTVARNGSKEMNFIHWVLSAAGQKIVNQFFIGIAQTEKSDPE